MKSSSIIAATKKAVVGIAKVTRTAYPDPTAKEGDWSTVDLAAVKPLATASYTSRDQEQFALERNSVNSSIAFISHASGRTRVSGNREYGRTVELIEREDSMKNGRA